MRDLGGLRQVRQHCVVVDKPASVTNLCRECIGVRSRKLVMDSG